MTTDDDAQPTVTLTHDQAALAIRWYTRLPIPVTAEDVELASYLKEATA